MSGALLVCMSDIIKVTSKQNESGAIGYVLAWLIGIPLPILLAVFLIRGCD